MAELARNIVKTPRPDGDYGQWRVEEPAGMARPAVADELGAGLDGTTAEALTGATDRAMYCPVDAVWVGGHEYRLTARVWSHPDHSTYVGLVPTQFTTKDGYAGAGGYNSWVQTTYLAVVSGGSAPGWRTITEDLILPAVSKWDDGLNDIEHIDGMDLSLVVFQQGSGQLPKLSHVRVSRLDPGPDPVDGYFDGDGRAPTDDTDHDDDPGHAFMWTGEPFGSASIVDDDPEPVVISDPGAELTGKVDEPLEPFILTGSPEGLEWTADGLPDGLTIGASSGTITGTPTTAGTGTATITAALGDRDDTLALPWKITDEPDTDELWGELDELADRLAPRVAAWIGRPSDERTLELARGTLPVVAEYVRGFTRGNGWTDGVPVLALQTVIVAAAGRIVVNPEQVTYYSSGDYSERPATLTGWTLAELGVLRNYRKVRA